MPSYKVTAEELATVTSRPRRRVFYVSETNEHAARERALRDATALHGFTQPSLLVELRTPNMGDAR